jgi:hypothetical protein
LFNGKPSEPVEEKPEGEEKLRSPWMLVDQQEDMRDELSEYRRRREVEVSIEVEPMREVLGSGEFERYKGAALAAVVVGGAPTVQ